MGFNFGSEREGWKNKNIPGIGNDGTSSQLRQAMPVRREPCLRAADGDARARPSQASRDPAPQIRRSRGSDRPLLSASQLRSFLSRSSASCFVVWIGERGRAWFAQAASKGSRDSRRRTYTWRHVPGPAVGAGGISAGVVPDGGSTRPARSCRALAAVLVVAAVNMPGESPGCTRILVVRTAKRMRLI